MDLELHVVGSVHIPVHVGPRGWEQLLDMGLMGGRTGA